MNSSASLCLKVLSLALVVWAVMTTSGLAAQNATWVPWLALLLLMLMDAYATDSKPAAWAQWSVGLLRLLGPGMFPYYAVMAAFLAFGPGQVRHITPPGAPIFSGPPNKFDRQGQGPVPGNLPNQHPGANSGPTRPIGFPANNGAPRPMTNNTGASGQPAPSAAGAPPNSSPVQGAPVNGVQSRPAVFQRPTGGKPPANSSTASTVAPAANGNKVPSGTPPANGAITPGVTSSANGKTAPSATPPVNSGSAPATSTAPAVK